VGAHRLRLLLLAPAAALLLLLLLLRDASTQVCGLELQRQRVQQGQEPLWVRAQKQAAQQVVQAGGSGGWRRVTTGRRRGV
jgi:hypothetical protein